VIDRSQSLKSQVEQIRSIAPNLDAAFNTIGNEETDRVAAGSFASNGRIASTLPVSEAVLAEYPKASGNMIYSSPIAHPENAAKAWTHLEEALKKGDLLPLPGHVFGGLSSTPEALQAVKKASGYKVIVHPQE